MLTNFSLVCDGCDDDGGGGGGCGCGGCGCGCGGCGCGGGGGGGGSCGSEGNDGVAISELIYFIFYHKHT